MERQDGVLEWALMKQGLTEGNLGYISLASKLIMPEHEFVKEFPDANEELTL